MDITLIKTYLTVIATESFVDAAERIHVTQSTVSQRIQKLEDQIGHRLFNRSKSGVMLTPEGARFEEYARSLMNLWGEAVYQTALPDEFTGSLSLGCEESLWPELSARWLSELEKKLPTTALRFTTTEPQNLANMMLRGMVDIAVMYMPLIRPGFKVEHIMDDALVLVTGKKDHDGTLRSDYVYSNWGQEFAMAHSRWFPELKPPHIQLDLGPEVAQYLIDNEKTTFLPYRIADDYVAEEQLFFVKDAPEMPFPSYAVWTETKPKEILDIALEELRYDAKHAPWIELKR
ncbi:MAG: LysR family transcriptional regulator [Rhizobiaceae bacterium]|nr:LysR family transcriptional regulator [Rhizobiaceae bacterium]